MHEHHQYETDPARPEAEPERRPPSIYVASLSDYNHGRLHGVWIDATMPLEDMWAATAHMLAQADNPGAEEIAIHDHADFGAWGLRREFVLIDETAVWKQILLAG